ncbi:MAG: hypothetical protein ABIG95_04320, partial [Candidatus Woesearchaeota archaeon]
CTAADMCKILDIIKEDLEAANYPNCDLYDDGEIEGSDSDLCRDNAAYCSLDEECPTGQTCEEECMDGTTKIGECKTGGGPGPGPDDPCYGKVCNPGFKCQAGACVDACPSLQCPDKCEGNKKQTGGHKVACACVYQEEVCSACRCEIRSGAPVCIEPDNNQADCTSCGFNWTQTECCGDDSQEFVKKDWYNRELGCCKSQNSCLVDQSAEATKTDPLLWFNNDGPRCIDSDKFIMDHLCENGEWTSRTRNVALQLLEQVKTAKDYAVFCDSFKNALNYYDYAVDDEFIKVSEILGEEGCTYGSKEFSCLNNFCVLTNSDGTLRIFGSSLNPGFDLANLNTLLDYGGSCAGVPDNGAFHQCSGGGTAKLWYNKKYDSFVYTTQGLRSVNWITQFATALKDVFSTLLNKIFPSEPFVPAYIKNAKQFDQIYMSKKSGREILAKQEEAYVENEMKDILTIEYKGFTTNLCTEINKISPGSCTASSSQYVKAMRLVGETSSIFDNWVQLTAKMRVMP